MLKKAAFVVGFGAGFLVGSYMGREPFEKVQAKVTGVVEDPEVRRKVQEGTHKATSTVKEQAPVVGEPVWFCRASSSVIIVSSVWFSMFLCCFLCLCPFLSLLSFLVVLKERDRECVSMCLSLSRTALLLYCTYPPNCNSAQWEQREREREREREILVG